MEAKTTETLKDKIMQFSGIVSTSLFWVLFSTSIMCCLFRSSHILLNAIVGLIVTLLMSAMTSIGVANNRYGYAVIMISTSALLAIPLIFSLLLQAL